MLRGRGTVCVYIYIHTRIYIYIYICVYIGAYIYLPDIYTTMFAYGTGTQFPGGKFACTLRNEACTFLYNLAHVARPTSRVTIGSILIHRSRLIHDHGHRPFFVGILRQRSRNISP